MARTFPVCPAAAPSVTAVGCIDFSFEANSVGRGGEMTDARTKLPERDFLRARTLAAPGAEILQMLRSGTLTPIASIPPQL